MLYVLCDAHGVPLEDTAKISDSDPRVDGVQPFGMHNHKGVPIQGYLMTLDGNVHRAIADATPSGTSMELPTADPETKDEIHVPADIEEAEEQDEEPSSD